MCRMKQTEMGVVSAWIKVALRKQNKVTMIHHWTYPKKRPSRSVSGLPSPEPVRTLSRFCLCDVRESPASGLQKCTVAFIHILPKKLGVDQINNRYEIAVSVTNYVNEDYCSHVPILTPKKQTSVPMMSEPGKLQQHSVTSRALAGFWMLTIQWESRTGTRDFLQRLLSLCG